MTIFCFGQTESNFYTIAKKHTIFSNILEEEREFYVHVPEGFWGMDMIMKQYPVVFVLDGESQFLNAVSAIDFLSSAPQGNDWMPRSIVVGIPNTNRTRDLTPTKANHWEDPAVDELSGGGPKFLDFITKELAPHIDSMYATCNYRTIIGHSLGGLIVFEALLEYRNFFTNYLAIDPALNYDGESYMNVLVDTLRRIDLSKEKVFVAKAQTVPTFYELNELEMDEAKFVQTTRSNRRFLQLAESESWNIDLAIRDYFNENHFSAPYPAIYEGMKFFFDFYPFPEILDYYHPKYREKNNLVQQMKKHYQSISEQMGFEVIPMESYIVSWAFGLSHFDRSDLAEVMYDYNIELYPDHPSVYNTKARFMRSSGNQKEAIQLYEKSLLIKEDVEIRKLLEELQAKID
ncbi:MAG: alpha/beta hydrolase-fold protein [Bacteroidota bacterium]